MLKIEAQIPGTQTVSKFISIHEQTPQALCVLPYTDCTTVVWFAGTVIAWVVESLSNIWSKSDVIVEYYFTDLYLCLPLSLTVKHFKKTHNLLTSHHCLHTKHIRLVRPHIQSNSNCLHVGQISHSQILDHLSSYPTSWLSGLYLHCPPLFQPSQYTLMKLTQRTIVSVLWLDRKKA